MAAPRDPPWAEEPDEDADALRAALEEKEPPDPPWATAAPVADAGATPIDPPWVDDLPADTTPPPPIEPAWAAVEENEAERPPIDPPWADDEARGPVILRGPIDPPWVPDDVSDAIEAEEAPATPFEPDWATEDRVSPVPLPPMEPDWVDDAPLSAAQPLTPYDPDWVPTERPSKEPIAPIEPEWATVPRVEAKDDLFDPDWEEARPTIEDIPLPPMEPPWAVEVDNEAKQTRTDPFDEPADDDGEVIEPDTMVVRSGARRLRDIVSGTSLNPFGRAKRAAAAREEDRAKLIADAMKIRGETREALGEDTVNAMYRALMGSDPPDDEKN